MDLAGGVENGVTVVSRGKKKDQRRERRHCCENIVGDFQYLRLGLVRHSRLLPQERDDRAVEEEQNDIAIPEKGTSPIVELSPLSPSPDNFIVKSISFLCPKDVNTNIPKKWILLSADRKAFSAYPWGRISYDITIKHLLKAVKTIDGKTTNLYGFPWAFMCWAFEVVPFLQKKYKTRTKDDKIEKLEIDLNGVVAIKRDIIIDEHNLDVGGGGASSPIFEGVFSGVGDGGGGEFTPNVDRCTDGVDFERGGDFGDISGGFGVGTSSPIDENVLCLQETPSTKETIDLLNVRVESLEKTIVTMNAKIESLEKAIVTMKSKRGIRPSSKISHPYTPDYVKRTKRQISKALSSARKKKKGKVNETIIEKELVFGDSKDEGADIADEEADSNSKRSKKE
ncbi:hypothetical protein MTR67_020178 [Solanum verrucosum]|uniref:DUF1985 domain-containing protein n=1 Tax=Solanum verrucosum TaxID=315347 RepID=A0AAF0QR29_SOLVR|nr:hypothetical protein MTR67_020178 [Solanum verrucosum]